MLELFVAVIHVALLLNAFVRSVRERFVVGVVGGVLRGLLMVVSTWYATASILPGLTGQNAAPGYGLLATAVLGPTVSFVVLVLAYLRMRNVPAAQEERASRVFMPWLGVGVVDGLYVVFAVTAYILAF